MADSELMTAPTTDSVTEDGVEETEFAYPMTVEDAGPATKKITIEIPEQRIKDKLGEQMKQIRREATIPGFRVGHAPAKLIEKKYGTGIREEVRRSLIGESYQQAVTKNNLQVLGEPEFDAAANLSLPDSGPLSLSFQVEVQPEITLPSLTGIAVKKPKIEIKEENVDQAMANLREQQGTMVPIEDGGIVAKDYVTADVFLKLDGNVVAHQHDAQLVARPARIGGVDVPDFDKQIEGVKIGETKSFPVKVGETHTNELMRGKDVQMEVTVKEIKRLELAEITPEFLEDLGFVNEQEIRDALKEQMIERVNYDIAQAQREQVSKYLLDNTILELPTKLSAKQVDRVVQRKMMDLLMRGVAQDKVMAQADQLRFGAAEEAGRELKLFFILQKIATDQETDVEESELNGRIGMLAAQKGERPEKLKQEMAKDGSLNNLYIQMREQKALDKVLESAQITEEEFVPPTAPTPVESSST